MELKTIHWIIIFLGILTIFSSYFFYGSKSFYLIFGIGIILIVFPFILIILNESKIRREKKGRFLDFMGDLVEGIEVGIPINKSIENLKNKSYGALNENVRKLSNQVSMGIPVQKAFEIFSKDIKNKTITRAITIISQAETAGGAVGEILQNVADTVNLTDRLEKERKSEISSLVTEGYLIFFIFICIILLMQFKIIPILQTSGVNLKNSLKTTTISEAPQNSPVNNNSKTFSDAFTILLLVQGFFMGLIIGQLSEGRISSGVKHSFILMIFVFIITSLANMVL